MSKDLLLLGLPGEIAVCSTCNKNEVSNFILDTAFCSKCYATIMEELFEAEDPQEGLEKEVKDEYTTS